MTNDNGSKEDELRFGSAKLLPADLIVSLLLTLGTLGAVYLPIVRNTPVRVIFGVPFVLLIPGYVLIAALYPERNAESSKIDNVQQRDIADTGLTGQARVALSIGGSFALVSMVGLGLNYSPFGIRLVPIVTSLAVTVLGLTIIAAWRRRALPLEDRFAVPWRRWFKAAQSELFDPESGGDAALNILLGLSVLIAAISVGYVAAVPKPGEALTEFYLLTENDQGELVTDGYPTEFTVGESKPLVIGIENYEGQSIEYTIIIELQRVRVQNDSTQVLAGEQLQIINAQVNQGETWRSRHTVTPTMTGESLRLTYLLYKGSPPSNPTTENAYRRLQLWINVDDANQPLTEEG